MFVRQRPSKKRADPERPLFRGEAVTVCIAAVSRALNQVIAISDTMISSDETSVEGVCKSACLSANGPWLLMYAGIASDAKPLIRRIGDHIKNGSAVTAAKVVAACEQAYQVELLKRVESEVLLPYGMTREEFFAAGRERFGNVT